MKIQMTSKSNSKNRVLIEYGEAEIEVLGDWVKITGFTGEIMYFDFNRWDFEIDGIPMATEVRRLSRYETKSQS